MTFFLPKSVLYKEREKKYFNKIKKKILKKIGAREEVEKSHKPNPEVALFPILLIIELQLQFIFVLKKI